jgi:ketosteroid isomerase-like protein
MSEPETVRALAARFFDAIEAGDADAALACYAPDARIWHNTDEGRAGRRRERAAPCAA